MPSPSTESRILTTTLIPPSSLSTIISLSTFKTFFPPHIRSHPQIQTLYRSLQHQRGLDLDLVRENIEVEVQHGREQLRELVRTRAHDGAGTGSEDAEIGVLDDEAEKIANKAGNGGKKQAHTAASIVPALEAAVKDLEAEVSSNEEETEALRKEMEEIVGGLSDLKYGKSKKTEAEEALEVLRELDREVEQSMGESR